VKLYTMIIIDLVITYKI